ncbi:hypothetical protein [Nocardia sp. NPDC050435]
MSASVGLIKSATNPPVVGDSGRSGLVNSPDAYAEPILHRRRREAKAAWK